MSSSSILLKVKVLNSLEYGGGENGKGRDKRRGEGGKEKEEGQGKRRVRERRKEGGKGGDGGKEKMGANSYYLNLVSAHTWCMSGHAQTTGKI